MKDSSQEELATHIANELVTLTKWHTYLITHSKNDQQLVGAVLQSYAHGHKMALVEQDFHSERIEIEELQKSSSKMSLDDMRMLHGRLIVIDREYEKRHKYFIMEQDRIFRLMQELECLPNEELEKSKKSIGSLKGILEENKTQISTSVKVVGAVIKQAETDNERSEYHGE